MRIALLAIALAAESCAPAPDALTVAATHDLPDIPGYPRGHGFTITGIDRAPDGTIWAASDGRILFGDASPFRPALVHLSADFARVIEVVRLPWNSSAQGVAVLPNGVAVALPDAKLIVLVGADRQPHVLHKLPVQPSGLTATPSGRLIFTEARKPRGWWIERGKLAGSISLPRGADQLAFADGSLWVTADPGAIYRLSAAGWVQQAWRGDIPSIEGLIVERGGFTIASDGLYHRKAAKNRVLHVSPSEASDQGSR